MTPLILPRYISLATADTLDADVVKCWFRCVREHAPNGTVMSVPGIDDKGTPRAVSLVHREMEGQHLYMVPLTRDLTEDEAETVVQAFAAENADLDFDISISSPMADRLEQEANDIPVEQDRYLALCDAWAKRQHEAWMKEREEQGWTYGTTVSLKNKTHPLMRPWSELPAKFKKVDLSQPQALVDLLNDQGFVFVAKSELESLMRLMRGVA